MYEVQCPCCMKSMSALATRCPHCTTQFEIGVHQVFASYLSGLGVLSVLGLFVGLVAGLSLDGPDGSAAFRAFGFSLAIGVYLGHKLGKKLARGVLEEAAKQQGLMQA